MAVDAPGVRTVLETAEKAKEKNLCRRLRPLLPLRARQARDGQAHPRRRRSATSRRIHCNYHGNGLWHGRRKPDWSDMEYQMRNWYYFTWLSGDFIVEQHVHSLDKAAWVMKDEYPSRAIGIGGRQVAHRPEVRQHLRPLLGRLRVRERRPSCSRLCRQQAGAHNDVSDHVLGTKGSAAVSMKQHDRGHGGQEAGSSTARTTDMYQTEHDELFASIRGGQADQQRRVHGQEHAAGDHGPDGGLHRPGDHLGAWR